MNSPADRKRDLHANSPVLRLWQAFAGWAIMPLTWGAQQLRATVFSDAPVTLSESDWTSITGQSEAEDRIPMRHR